MSRFRNRSLSSPVSSRTMSRVTAGFLLLLVLVLGGTMAFLATWDMPAPKATVEKVIPDERFPR